MNHDELFDFVGHRKSFGLLFPLIAVVPFLGHQFSLPAENRVGSEDRTDPVEHLPAKNLTFDRQATALNVVEQDLLLTQLLFEDLVFRVEVLNDALLLPG